jgi:hypothetical protein
MPSATRGTRSSVCHQSHRVNHGRIVVEDGGLRIVHPDVLGNTTRRDVIGMNDRYEPPQPEASERQEPSEHELSR